MRIRRIATMRLLLFAARLNKLGKKTYGKGEHAAWK